MKASGETSSDEDQARLRRLFLFDAVCEAGGIGQAAIRAGRTQPAVSVAISKLEAGFGGPLFERGFGGSELTGEGLILQRRVRRMLDQIERAVMGLTGQATATHAAKICRRLTDAQVRCHIAIADAGSAAEAALSLGISQPAVHRAARQIEQNVGVSLYRRRVHSVSANAAGIEFARCLSLALHEIAQAGEDLAYARGQLTGKVAIGVLPLLPPRLVARVIQRLREGYPAARVTVEEGSHAHLLRKLRSGALDIIIGGLRGARLAGAAQETELFADPYVAAVRKGHRLARRKRIALLDLAGHDWVMPEHNVPRRAVIDSIFEQLPVKPPLVLETSSLAMMLAMLMESDCITLLSRAQIRDAYPGRELVALELALPEARRAVGYTVRSDWLGTAVQQAFVELLRSESALESAHER
ncbi:MULTISPECIES: LysR substrate-binding domain-containing protein [Burkholderiaceae]|uniref:LysR substrate-binding domain-containing protein n=1 Tax=Burkholderiaceae TaxID=119060 RepID=UPI00142056FB|nr:MULTISPECIES: LysR substrate-binding domain-containing protein [Burkholderiaceae]NIF52845.1 LysR family transcriptional regulator [Burkholderia sp. Ax-1724]NIF78784.1 LysR family transcriptional regulator [Paraburkholderia sp. Cy-641]